MFDVVYVNVFNTLLFNINMFDVLREASLFIASPPWRKTRGGEKIFDELLGGAKKILTNFWGGRKKFRRTFGGGEKNFNALSMEIGGFWPILRGGEKNFDELLGGGAKKIFFASNPDLNHQVDLMAIIKS